MAFPSYSTGTASVSAGGTTVTAGGGANWGTTNVQPGDTLQIGNFQSIITDNTSSTLTIPPWGGGNQSAVAYKIFKTSVNRVAGGESALDVSRLVAALNTKGYFVFVGPDETVPDPSYGDEGQFAFKPDTGEMWELTSGVWTSVGTFRGFGVPAAYNGGTSYKKFDVVTSAGSSYIYINATPSTGNAPPNATYWAVLASKGDPGANGSPGATGAQGPAAGIRQAYSSTTADADPGAGTFRLNNATPASATAAYLDNVDAGGVTVTAVWDTYDDSTSTVRGRIRFEKSTNPAVWAEFNVTGSVVVGAGYRKLTLANGVGSGAFTAADVFSISFSRTGNSSAGDMLAANNLSDLASLATAVKNLGLRFGQCQLNKVSTNLVLTPVDGNLLTVNGVPNTVPDAGVSLAATGLTPGTTYYIYATASGGAINALEASTTAPAVSTTAGNKGVKIKTGDDTRTLVGQARVITGPAWQDTAAQRFVRSYFNDSGVALAGSATTSGTSSSSFTEVNSAARAEFLSWAGELVDITCEGTMTDSAGANSFAASIGIDSASAASQPVAGNNYTASARFGFSTRYTSRALAEGYHYATPLLRSISSTSATFNSDSGAAIIGTVGGRL